MLTFFIIHFRVNNELYQINEYDFFFNSNLWYDKGQLKCYGQNMCFTCLL